MTELEILAGLKTAYIRIEDIIDNQDKQITEEQAKQLIQILNTLEKQYQEIIGEIPKNERHYKENLYVAPFIFYDYTTDEKEFTEFLPYAELENEEKWWEDYNFLLK